MLMTCSPTHVASQVMIPSYWLFVGFSMAAHPETSSNVNCLIVFSDSLMLTLFQSWSGNLASYQ